MTTRTYISTLQKRIKNQRTELENLHKVIKRLREQNQYLCSLHECPECKHFVSCEPSTLGICDVFEKEDNK